MADLVTQTIQSTGLAPALASATNGGDYVNPGDHTYVEVNNASGSTVTATLETPGNDQFGSAAADLVISVPASGRRLIGPVTRKFAAPGGAHRGKAKLTISVVTSVTVGAFSV